MGSQSLYRKWRSQTFAEVVGQEHITRTLLNALRNDRVAHAYLFCGPRGTGKTSTARLLAKAVNCERNGGRSEPCNECEICRAITEGRLMDVVEIDGASNRGIDEIRDLREKANFAPGQARRKFYIIDEVHQLSPDAFNALLKTLEEPPAHVVFVLASTEVHKIPATILSRCQRFDFRRIPVRDTVERLRYICEAEGIEVEPAALEAIARAATGSLRDAEGMLDQLRAYADGRITVAQVEALLGTAGSGPVRELVVLALEPDLSGGLRLINRLADEGTDMRQLGREVVDVLRQLLLLKTGALTPEGLDVTADTATALAELAKKTPLEQILRVLRVFSQADFSLRGLVQPQLPLELAFAEAVLGPAQEPAATQPGLVEQPRPSSFTPPAPSTEERAAPTPPVIARPRRATRPVIASPAREEREEPPAAAPEAASAPAQGAAEEATVEQAREVWPSVIDAVGRIDRKVQALLRDSTGPERVDAGTMVLGFAHEFHRDQIDQHKNRVVVENAIAEVLGRQYRIRCELATKQSKAKPQTSPIDDPLVREAIAQGARIKGVISTPPKENGHDDAQ